MTPEIDELIAERACERLLIEYSRRVDYGEAARIADLFVVDGVWRGVDLELRGQERIREWFTRREALDRRVSRHVVTNVAVRLDGPDRAEVLSYLINYRFDREQGDRRMPVPSDAPKYVGECRDVLVRTADGWRFAEREVSVAFARASRPR